MNTINQQQTVAGLMMVIALSHVFAAHDLDLGGTPSLPSTGTVAKAPAAFEKSLREFLTLAEKDPAVCSLLSKHKVSFQYTIRDLGLNCYVGFNGKKIVSDFGTPARPSEITFASDSGLLERVLRGEKGDAKLQISVKLGLVRKLKLSQDLPAIRGALGRVYATACQKVTDGGNSGGHGKPLGFD